MSESFLHRHRRKALVLAAGAALYGVDRLAQPEDPVNSTSATQHVDHVRVPKPLRPRVTHVNSADPVAEPTPQYFEDENDDAEREMRGHAAEAYATEIQSMLGDGFRVRIGVGKYQGLQNIVIEDRQGNSFGTLELIPGYHSLSLMWTKPEDVELPPGVYVPYFPFLLDGQINPDAVFDSVSFVDDFRGPVPEMEEAMEDEIPEVAQEQANAHVEEAQDTGVQGEEDIEVVDEEDTAPAIQDTGRVEE